MLFSPLCSGSSGNAAYLEADGTGLLIDAGATAKQLDALLNAIRIAPSKVRAILITHEHSDHIKGAGVFSRKYDIPVYAAGETMEAMLPSIGGLPPRNMRVFEPDRPFYLKTLAVLPFSTPHDCAHPVGFAFMHGGKKVTVMTDIGHVTASMLDAAADSDLLMLESNHDADMLRAGSYPYPLKMRILGAKGHLCNEDAGHALVRLYVRGVRNVILGHLSNENNTPELALVTVKSVLEEADLADKLFLTVASRYEPTGVFDIQ